jgi:hypothetical protein
LDEVARMMIKTPATVRYDMCRHPERVPPHFKLPGNSRKPLWHPETVRQFILESAAKHGALPKGRSGGKR